MNTLKARLAIEIYRYSQKWLPSRFRIPLKRYINEDRPEWTELPTVTVTLQDTPYQLELNLKHWHQRWTYIKGHYPEPHIATLLKKHLNTDSVFIDVGANIGIHSLLAAAIIGDAKQVWAIEPNPHSFARLNSHINKNRLHGMHLHQVALGNSNGTAYLDDCSDMSVGSSLRNSGDTGCEVPMVQADTLLAQIPEAQSGICKIDVEGFELEVLRGMAGFVRRHSNFAYIVEVTAEWLVKLGGSADELFAFFLEQGFCAYEIQLPDGKLHRLNNPLENQQYDVFFSKQEF